jgi:alginate O-acetyltransferase complex protein AlgI
MLFTDLKFFGFFAVVFAVYWSLTSNTWRKCWLLAASIVFYAGWDWRFLGLVLVVIVDTYAVTLLVHRFRHHGRLILTVGVVVSLSILGVFKYYDFFVTSLGGLLNLHPVTAQLILPIGISFYTFHALSYMIDTYRGKIVPTRNFADVALYILFFPQLVAGPIVRATDLLPQMREARRFDSINFKYLLLLFLIGYFKKAVVSDNVSGYVDAFYANPGGFGTGDAAMGIVFYTVQIYCDFSGYTDMAIATAGLLGYRLKPNFNHPYLAPNLIEFWRRWHMSLSFWLRDYLYIPLGGNHGSRIHQLRTVMITMLLGGLWHGASWTFVVWGGLHGLGLVVCRIWRDWRTDRARYSLAGNALTLTFVCLLWIPFRASTFGDAVAVFGSLAHAASPTLMPWAEFTAILLALSAAHVAAYQMDLERLVVRWKDTVFACGYGVAVAAILPFVNVKVVPFIYFQF